MLGLLKPKSPVEIREKVWTERRMRWLAQRFGLDRMKSATVVLPTTDFFPGQYAGQPSDVADVFGRVCEYMGSDPDRFDLGIKKCCQGGSCGDIQAEEKPVVQLGAEDVADQERLIATFARSIARDELLRGKHVDPNEGDFDSLTDLLPVFMGMGIFQANTAIKSTAYRQGDWEYWSIRGAGYLQSRVPGYAMALMAWIRDEPNPAWANMLGTDAQSAFRKGYKYVTKTGDCLFRPDNASQPIESRSTATIADDLVRGTDTMKVSRLWDVMTNPALSSGAIEGIASCVRDRNPGVAAEAARAVAVIGPDAEPVVPALLERLSAPEAELRAYCAMAIESIKPSLDACPDGLQVREELEPLLKDRNPGVVDAAVRAFAVHGKDAEPALRSVMPRIILYARDCEFSLLTSAVQQLASVVDEPEVFFRAQLENTDSEIRDRVMGELTALLEGTEDEDEDESTDAD